MLTAEEVRRKGLDVLQRELGMADTLRFLGLFDNGQGDYTAERHKWLEDGRSLDDVIADLTRRRMTQVAEGHARYQADEE